MKIVKVLLSTVALAVVFALGFFAGFKIFSIDIPEIEEVAEVIVEDNSEEIIQAITRSEQVVLLSLQIQGISERTEKSTLFGVEVPGSDRAVFIQYGFNAKLGMDGTEVHIEQTGDKQFTITIPEFIFIGHDDIELKTASETNGVLSWVTPEIDPVEMANDILSNEQRGQYLDANDTILRDQARAFYDGIIMAVDPEVLLTFTFESEPDLDSEATSAP